MNNANLKKEIDRLMTLKGESTGEILRTHAAYINYKKGEAGIRAIEKKLSELGHPFSFKDIAPLAWYPEGLGVSIILIAKNIFDWSDEDIFDMGNAAPKYSFIIKLFIHHFVSLERFLKEAQKYWYKHFNFGELEVVGFDKKEKYVRLRVKGYNFNPIICKFHAGYFLRIAQFILKSENIKIEETKCIYKGDPYHEYLITWD